MYVQRKADGRFSYKRSRFRFREEAKVLLTLARFQRRGAFRRRLRIEIPFAVSTIAGCSFASAIPISPSPSYRQSSAVNFPQFRAEICTNTWRICRADWKSGAAFPLPRGREIEPGEVTNVVGYVARPTSKHVRKFLVRHVRKGNPVSFPPPSRVWPRFQPLILP